MVYRRKGFRFLPVLLLWVNHFSLEMSVTSLKVAVSRCAHYHLLSGGLSGVLCSSPHLIWCASIWASYRRRSNSPSVSIHIQQKHMTLWSRAHHLVHPSQSLPGANLPGILCWHSSHWLKWECWFIQTEHRIIQRKFKLTGYFGRHRDGGKR